MKIKINGVEMYDSLGEAVTERVKGIVQNTEWYRHEPPNFDLVNDFESVKLICKDDLVCYMDSFNWSVMNKTELTADIYKFITHRVWVFKDGFANNFWPEYVNWNALFEEWDLVLDCVLWFI